ncbi:defensin-7-like [Molossus molossus]|uniref:defensin-7-like n=1 Tax=Molossus molossus TaxID=27622 RepID=UPI00174759F7|nr:defensin-7-like [Molossus molossus]
MRTLVLLAALLLVAFQARAQRLQETADQVPAWDQPEAEDQDQLLAEDQDQAGAEDQDMAITFTGEERLTREASGPSRQFCHPNLAGSVCGEETGVSQKIPMGPAVPQPPVPPHSA